jgi:hypothetical protein
MTMLQYTVGVERYGWAAEKVGYRLFRTDMVPPETRVAGRTRVLERPGSIFVRRSSDHKGALLVL